MPTPESEWQRRLDIHLPRLRSGHWDARPTRSGFFQLFMLMFFNKPVARPARWLSKQVDALERAGELRTVARLRQQLQWSGVLKYKTQQPVVARLMAKLDATSTEPKPDYVFRREGSYMLRDIDRLSTVDRRQFLAAAASYLGKRFKTPKAFFQALGADLEESPDEIEAVRWRIAKKEKPKRPLFEMWTFLVDNGRLFEIGKPTPLGVHVIQGAFAATDRDPTHHRLAEDLQRSVPF